jgi:hypothetical protein
MVEKDGRDHLVSPGISRGTKRYFIKYNHWVVASLAPLKVGLLHGRA